MASSLENTLNWIQSDKNKNLLPEHLKAGVTCLGITGTLETGSSEIPIKLFTTKEEMDADITSEIGQLGIVYRNITTPMAEGMTTDRLGYPSRVTLDTAVSSSQNSGMSATGRRNCSFR